MAGISNLVFLRGHLGGDVDMRYTANGQAVSTFRLAATRRYQQNGEWKEDTEWVTVVCWRELAEQVGLLRKGQGVFVEGKLRTRSYEKDGVKRYVTEVVADQVYLALSKQGQQQGGELDPDDFGGLA